jgi:hypothetical protein
MLLFSLIIDVIAMIGIDSAAVVVYCYYFGTDIIYFY